MFKISEVSREKKKKKKKTKKNTKECFFLNSKKNLSFFFLIKCL